MSRYPFQSRDDFPEEASPDEINELRTEAEQAVERRKTRCKKCKYAMTWAAQRAQYKRLCELNVDRELFKNLLPRCQKCMTLALKGIQRTVQ